MERARAVRPEFGLTQANALPVATICRLLDGLPLAIELAAARMRLFPEPATLLTRLEPSLPLLVGGPRDAPARQQTMRDAISWSYDLLTQDEQAMFRRMGVFVGGCALDAAEKIAQTVASEGIDVVVVVEALVEASMLRVSRGADGNPRFEMLQTLRDFALEDLRNHGEEEVSRLVHSQYFLEWIQQFRSEFVGPHLLQTLPKIGEELPNLDAAMRACEASRDFSHGLELAGSLWRYWYYRGLLFEGRQWFGRLLPHVDGVPERTVAWALEGAAGLAYAQGDVKEASNLYEKCSEICCQLGDNVRMYRIKGALGSVAEQQGRFQDAKALLENSFSQLKLLNDISGVATGLNNLGKWEIDHGDLDRAAELLAESREAYLSIGDQIGLAQSILNIGVVEEKRGNFQAAEDSFKEAAALGRAIGMPALVAAALHNRGNLACDRCDYQEAEDFYRISLNLKRELGNLKDTAMTLNGLGNLVMDLEQFDHALECFEEIASIGESVADVRCAVWGLNGKALVKQFQAATHEAASLFDEALRLSREGDYQAGVAMTLNNRIVLSPASLSETMLTYGECLQIFTDLEDPSGVATVQQNLGRLSLQMDDFQTALSLFQAALGRFWERGERLNAVACLEDIGDCLGTQGRIGDATRCYAVAHRVRDEAGVPLPHHVRPQRERRVQLARDTLGINAFHRQWKLGSEWPLEEAITYATHAKISK